MKYFKGTKGNWQMIFNHYKHEPKKICTGVGIVEKINVSCEHIEVVCISLLPATAEEYLKQREQIEADMKLIAAAPKMLAALIEISEGKGRYNQDKLIHASNTIEDLVQLAKEAINSANSGAPGYIYSEKEIKEKVIDEYPEQFENLLHEFFNKTSDSNKYLTAEQQEEMESEFCDFIYQYNK